MDMQQNLEFEFHTTTNNTFYDNDFTSPIKNLRYNSWTHLVFFLNIIYFIDYFENRGINLFSVHASNPNNLSFCFYLIKSDIFLNILF